MTERGGVLGKLQEMEKRATGKVSAPVDLSAPAPTQHVARVIQLPLWPEAVRGVPNSVLRSALFGAIKRGRRAYLGVWGAMEPKTNVSPTTCARCLLPRHPPR